MSLLDPTMATVTEIEVVIGYDSIISVWSYEYCHFGKG